MRIGMIVAMASERSQIEKFLEGLHTVHGEKTSGTYQAGTVKGNEIVLVQAGIGKVNAALGAQGLILDFNPDCMISTGVAGGIDRSLSVMDVVVAKEVVYHDVDCGSGNEYGQVQGLPPRFSSDKHLYDMALSLKTDLVLHGGLVCSGDQFISDRKHLDTIKSRFPEALAVEMESGAIAQTCHLHHIPFLGFRIVSDIPVDDDSKTHYSHYENFWQTMADKSFSTTKAFLDALPSSLGDL